MCASGCLASPEVQASLGQVCSNCISGQLNNIVTQQMTIPDAIGAYVHPSLHIMRSLWSLLLLWGSLLTARTFVSFLQLCERFYVWRQRR